MLGPMAKAPIVQALSDRPAKPQRKSHQPLALDDQMAILWGLSRGWSYTRIASMVGNLHRHTVRSYHRRIFDEPELVFRCPGVYVNTARAGHFRCGFCPALRKGEMSIRRHVLSHVLPVERARDVRLNVGRRQFL